MKFSRQINFQSAPITLTDREHKRFIAEKRREFFELVERVHLGIIDILGIDEEEYPYIKTREDEEYDEESEGVNCAPRLGSPDKIHVINHCTVDPPENDDEWESWVEKTRGIVGLLDIE